MSGAKASPRFPMRSSASSPPIARDAGGRWRCMMSRLLTGQEEFHDSSYDSYRSNLTIRQHTANDYRFGRSRAKRGRRMRRALRRVNGWLKTLIEAIAKFEAAPYRARARVPRHSPRPTPQQSGGAQIRADGAFTMKSPALVSLLRAVRSLVIIVRSVRRSAGQAIPSRGSLHARPRTEMAGKASVLTARRLAERGATIRPRTARVVTQRLQ